MPRWRPGLPNSAGGPQAVRLDQSGKTKGSDRVAVPRVMGGAGPAEYVEASLPVQRATLPQINCAAFLDSTGKRMAGIEKVHKRLPAPGGPAVVQELRSPSHDQIIAHAARRGRPPITTGNPVSAPARISLARTDFPTDSGSRKAIRSSSCSTG